MSKQGWLDRHREQAMEEIKQWPEWMKKEAGFDKINSSTKQDSTAKGMGNSSGKKGK